MTYSFCNWEYKIVPALILVLPMILVLACELVETQSLARACMLPPACMLLPALIVVPVWILVLPMTLVLVFELALACIPIEKSYQFSRVAIIVLAWMTNECPSSHAKSPFRLAATTSVRVHDQPAERPKYNVIEGMIRCLLQMRCCESQGESLLLGIDRKMVPK